MIQLLPDYLFYILAFHYTMKHYIVTQLLTSRLHELLYKADRSHFCLFPWFLVSAFTLTLESWVHHLERP